MNLLRDIPKMDVLLESEKIKELGGIFSKEELKKMIREELDAIRGRVLSGEASSVPEAGEIADIIVKRASGMSPVSLRKVVNATGVVLHTNLGRAPLGEKAADNLRDIISGYCNLEYDVERGARGSRHVHIEKILSEITGAESAAAVNNNAAAVFLMLNTLARGRRVAISRGELVEIGGSFRVPDIMRESGAELIEVGTTNKTRLSDYVRAVEEQGAEVLLKVHTSNFIISGFSESVSIEELASYGKEKGLTVLYDLGSAFLIEKEMLGINSGDTARKAIESGADVVTFSGDKLMGSAQAGLLTGTKDAIEKIKKNQLMRMVRPDKLQLAVLEMSLRQYKDPKIAVKEIPTLMMLSADAEELKMRAVSFAHRITEENASLKTEVVHVKDLPGGGSLPSVELEGYAVSVGSEKLSADELERSLRSNRIPVISKITDNMLLLSMRTLTAGDEEIIIGALRDPEARL